MTEAGDPMASGTDGELSVPRGAQSAVQRIVAAARSRVEQAELVIAASDEIESQLQIIAEAIRYAKREGKVGLVIDDLEAAAASVRADIQNMAQAIRILLLSEQEIMEHVRQPGGRRRGRPAPAVASLRGLLDTITAKLPTPRASSHDMGRTAPQER